MPTTHSADLSLLIDILHALERIGAPYAIVGAYAGAAYGLTRATYDIDIVVGLEEEHIRALADQYQPPRYYADLWQMRDSIRRGMMFNIIDGERGEKADLLPVTMHRQYRQVLANRVRHRVEIPGEEPFDAWFARLEDVIIGKLMAWAEGGSRKHETDIYQMLVFCHLGLDPAVTVDEQVVTAAAAAMGPSAAGLWQTVRAAAREQANRSKNAPSPQAP